MIFKDYYPIQSYFQCIFFLNEIELQYFSITIGSLEWHWTSNTVEGFKNIQTHKRFQYSIVRTNVPIIWSFASPCIAICGNFKGKSCSCERQAQFSIGKPGESRKDCTKAISYSPLNNTCAWHNCSETDYYEYEPSQNISWNFHRVTTGIINSSGNDSFTRSHEFVPTLFSPFVIRVVHKGKKCRTNFREQLFYIREWKFTLFHLTLV